MRVHRQKARQDYYCDRCKDLIPAGSEYFTYKFRFAKKRRIRCLKHFPRPSELTTSEKLSRAYGAREALEDALEFNVDITKAPVRQVVDGIENLLSEIETQADEAEQVADEYEEGADNQEEYFPGSSQAEESREKAQSLRDWANELLDAKYNVEDLLAEINQAIPELVESAEAQKTALNEKIHSVWDEVESALNSLSI